MDASNTRSLARLVHAAALAGCVGLAGCAGVAPSEAPSLTKASPVAAAAARSDHLVGKTKRDVLATLGQTATINFDSGYEIWVYHLRDGQPQRTQSPGEFVVLFDPSGVVTRTRVRPAPVPLSQASR
jgi:hypothetical protein